MVARRAPSGTVTFLFTDVEGSTSLWEREPEAMRAGLARHDELLRSVLADHGGHVFSTAGDAFAGRVRVARSTRSAAALAVQAALDRPNRGRHRRRSGCASGCTPGPPTNATATTSAPTLNRAARIMGIANGGEVLVSAATAELAGPCPRRRRASRTSASVEPPGHRRAERVFGVVAPGLRPTFGPART